MARPDDSSSSSSSHGQLQADAPVVDRRGFLTAAGAASLAALLVSACGGGSAGDPVGPGGGIGSGGGGGGGGALPTGISRNDNTLLIDVGVVSSLQSANGFVIVSDPATVVINVGDDTFRAFTAVCTHSGCLVNNVASGRINCVCHGSAFDANGGQVLRGPATRPLRSFPVSYARTTRLLTVSTS
jgi:nitrite reductase/ring-hydroxylating ferredoxin subunit